MVIKRFLGVSTVFFAFLFAVGLSVESYLNLQDKSFCKTTACEVVGNYIRFNESLLTAGGAFFFWILTLIFFFTNRYPDRLRNFPFLFLFPALAFDGVLIGFQFITIRQQCILCIAMALALIFVSLLYCLVRNYKVLALGVLLVWSAGFAASSVIIMPEPQNAYSRMVLYSTPPVEITKEKLQKPRPKMTLIFSMQCPHCLEVVKYLSTQDISGVTWQFATTDLDVASLAQLDHFLRSINLVENPFSTLHVIKTLEIPLPASVPKLIKKKSMATRTFLSNIGLTGVPVLVVEQDPSTKVVVTGTPAIVQYLRKMNDE